jgi:chemotaxis protein CheD
VLRIRRSEQDIPQSNIRFVRSFLESENIPIVSSDLGGETAREVYFFTDSGRVLLKRLPCDMGREAAWAAIERAEQAELAALARQSALTDDSNITLFSQE